MNEARFVVQRTAKDDGRRWAYIDSCPHGLDLGAICIGPAAKNERTPQDPHWDRITWKFEDLGNGRCRISPSILAKGVHNGADCHFGSGAGGEYPFIWLEEGELRNTEPFFTRYKAWVAGLPP